MKSQSLIAFLLFAASTARGSWYNSTGRSRTVWLEELHQGLKEFDPEYKNPCFTTESGEWRCLPYFNVIGTPKSGTTDLYQKLVALPQVRQAVKKEPHFWSRQRPIAEYLRNFPAQAIKDHPELVTGEASTTTFMSAVLPWWFDTANGSDSMLPHLVRAVQPGLKPIVSVRNPTDRLYSAFYFFGCWKNHTGLSRTTSQTGDYNPQTFHTWALENLEPMQACLATGATALHCASTHINSASHQLIDGLYHVAAVLWRAVYGNDIMFINFDAQYSANETATIIQVLQFLDLEVPPPTMLGKTLSIEGNRGLQNIHTPLRKRLTGCSNKHAPMLPETRRLLNDFYQPFNVKLAELLGDSSFLWEGGGQDSGDDSALLWEDEEQQGDEE